jgi:hypothetical protein
MTEAVVRFRIPHLASLVRHAAPHVIEGTIVPVALFAAALHVLGPWRALGVGLGWSYLAILRRVVRRRRVPGLLLIGALTGTARAAIALATGSMVVYFLQPTLGTVLVAGTFLASVPAGHPLAERLAHDFCPLPDSFARHPAVRRFFRRLSVLWAGVLLANAGLTAWLLFSQSLGTFVVARPLATGGLTVVAIGASVVWFRRTMHRHDLLAPPGS